MTKNLEAKRLIRKLMNYVPQRAGIEHGLMKMTSEAKPRNFSMQVVKRL